MKLFISTADESDDVPKVDKDQPTYGSYKLSEDEWELLMLIHQVLVVRYIAILFHCYYLHVISRLLLKFRKHPQLHQQNLSDLGDSIESSIESIEAIYVIERSVVYRSS
jgi:hypothetical protein